MDVRHLLAQQQDLVARWQLLRAGWSDKRVEHWVRRNQPQVVHTGVYAVQRGPLNAHQRRHAATLTTPTSVLSLHSAALADELLAFGPPWETITRPGTHGPRHVPGLRIHTTRTLAGRADRRHGFWCTTAERTAIDLWPLLADPARRKLLREGVRRRRFTVASLQAGLALDAGRRGTADLATRVARLDRLQLERCRSDAEAFAMEVLDDAHRRLPEVNQERAGLEADLSWAPDRVIVELDGPQFHRDPLEDAHRTHTWTQAGWTVLRLPTPELFADPTVLLGVAPR
jgi:hypothetical protein